MGSDMGGEGFLSKGPQQWPPAPDWAEHIRHARNSESGVRCRVYSLDLVSSDGVRGQVYETHIWTGKGFDRIGPDLEVLSEHVTVDGMASLLEQAASLTMTAEAA